LSVQGHRYYDEGLYFIRAIYQYELLAFVAKNFRKLFRGEEDLKDIFSKLRRGWYPRNANYQLHEWLLALTMRCCGQRHSSGLFLSAGFGLLTVVALPLIALQLGGKPAFWLALALVAVDSANVYYSRTAFGDTMAAFFLLLGLYCLWLATAGSFPLALLGGILCCCCLMSKTQYYFLVLAAEACLLVAIVFAAQSWLLLQLAVVFNLGLLLPILLIEGFYRLLKHWGYEQPTYLQLVRHQYFNITKDGDDYEKRSSYRREIPWFRWRWLQMYWSIQNPLYCLLLLVAMSTALLSGEPLAYGLIFVAAVPVFNWLRHEFCALRYLFASHLLLILLMALQVGPLLPAAWLPALATLIVIVGLFWNQKYLQPSAHRDAYKYLAARAEKIYSADFYNAQIYFPRDAVHYAPNSLDELRRQHREGFTHMLVDVHATFALSDAQEEVLQQIERQLDPVAEFPDESIICDYFWWEYCFSKLVNKKYERCFRVAQQDYRTVRIYDLAPLVQSAA